RPACRIVRVVIVHLIDGTFELFRYFMSPAAAFERSTPEALRAVRGVAGSILGMLEGGATHLGVATDHVIESFRNALWPGYKTGEGIDPVLAAQFEPLEEALGGDTADGYPGLPGWGAVSAATVLARYRHLEDIPKLALEWDVSVRGAMRLATTLAEQREQALLFRRLATLRTDAPLGVDVDGLRWTGPRAEFAAWSARLGAPALHERAVALAAARVRV